MAENMELESKMVKRRLVNYLVPLLQRETKELVLLVMEFLRKLSITPEHREVIGAENTVPAVVAVVTNARNPDALLRVGASPCCRCEASRVALACDEPVV
jgi:hypothetical protein